MRGRNRHKPSQPGMSRSSQDRPTRIVTRLSRLLTCATQEFYPGFSLSRTDHDPQPLDVVIRQEPSVVVGFQPVEEMNLIQVRAHEFFSQFVRLAADERHLQTREGRD